MFSSLHIFAGNFMQKTVYLLFFIFFLSISNLKSQDGNKIIIKDGKYGMTTTYNKVTKEIIKPKLDDIKHLHNNRIYIFKEKGKWGIFVVYTFKHEVYPLGSPEFDEIIFLKELQHNEKGDFMGSTAYIMVKKAGKTAFINFQIDEAPKKFNISPYFDEIGTTADSIKLNFKRLFYVKTDSLYGIYNARGIQKQPIIYQKHEQYSGENKIIYHILYKDNERSLLVDNQANNPLFNAKKIWFDQKIYVINNNDTLTYFNSQLKPINSIIVETEQK